MDYGHPVFFGGSPRSVYLCFAEILIKSHTMPQICLPAVSVLELFAKCHALNSL